MEEKFLQKIKKIILENLDDANFGVGKLSKQAGFSRSQMLRKVKAASGKSVNLFIREVRLQEAVKLIQEGDYTASEISYKVGFSSPSYFSKCFHDHFGYPPGEYQNNNEKTPIEKTSLERKESTSSAKIARIVILSISFLLITITALLVYQNFRPQTSIAVLPFQNHSENDEQDYLSDGFTEAIILELSKRSDLVVGSRTSAMQYKNTEKSIQEIAKELDVDLLLEGSFQIYADSLSVVAQLIDPFPKEKHIWADRFNIRFENVLHLVDKIATTIAEKIDLAVSPVSESDTQKVVNSQAYNLYLKGRHLFNQQSSRSISNSIVYLQQSIALDPNFSPAYATLAEAYITFNKVMTKSKEKLQNREKGRIAIEKALDLDNTSGANLISKAHVLGKFDWNWEGMKYFTEKGLKLDPNNANGHMLLSDYYLIKGNFNKAIEEALIAERLDPFNRMTGVLLGERYFLAGHNEIALKQYEKVVELFPNYGFARDGIGHVQYMSDNKEEAIKSWAVLMRIMKNEAMAKIYETEPFDIVLNKWLDQAKSEAPLFCSNPTIIAQALTYVNDMESAMVYLEVAFQKHDEELPLTLLRPHFIPLHTDKRFRKLAENVGVIITYGIEILP